MKNQRVALANSLPWLFAALVATLLTSPVSAADFVTLKDETRLDGTRTLEWTASKASIPGPEIEVHASCFLNAAPEQDRLWFYFRWRGMPAIKEGESILLQVAGGPIREHPAKMTTNGWIQALSASEVISQLLGKGEEYEFVIGVREASGRIIQRDMNLAGERFGVPHKYKLEVFRERCLNPDRPRAKENNAASLMQGNFELETVENGDLVLISGGRWGFRCLTEPQTSQGRRWRAGMIVMIHAWTDMGRPTSRSVRFDDEPQEIAMSRAPRAEYPSSFSSFPFYWSNQDATPILERALESQSVTYETRLAAVQGVERTRESSPAGVLDFEVFLARARRLGCNNEVVAATKAPAPAPAPSESGNQTPTLTTDDNIPFIYESRAEVPAPAELLFPLISQDYRRLRSDGDEFALRDLADRLQPTLERRLLNARDISRVTVKFGSGALGEYDFERSGFPTSFSESSYIPFDTRVGRYAIRFSNAANLSFVPVAESVARGLSSSMRRGRDISITVTGSILSAEETSVGKTVFVRAEQVDVALKSGEKVGTLQF